MIGDQLWFLISGLLSVVGAIIIALPDTPRLRMILWSERVREGLYEVENNGLTEDQVGYEEISVLLEEIYETNMSDDIWGFRAGYHTLSRYGFEAIYLFVDDGKESNQFPLGKELGAEIDYRAARSEIKRRINNYQARIRAAGFLLLALSFGFQSVGYLT